MMLAQSILFGAALFLALAFLLTWKYRRETKACRMERSLRLYAQRALAGAAWRVA